jgi:hypothetical protein
MGIVRVARLAAFIEASGPHHHEYVRPLPHQRVGGLQEILPLRGCAEVDSQVLPFDVPQFAKSLVEGGIERGRARVHARAEYANRAASASS